MGNNWKLPVKGQMPPFARVAAITDADSQVTSTEHSWNYSNITECNALKFDGFES